MPGACSRAPGLASLWLAAFALGAGLAMVAAGFIRNPRLYKPFLALGVALMGAGFLAAAGSANLVAVSFACGLAAAGFGLISTLGFSLFAALIPSGEADGYTALYYSLRAVASALAVPMAGLAIAASGSYRSSNLRRNRAYDDANCPSTAPSHGLRPTLRASRPATAFRARTALTPSRPATRLRSHHRRGRDLAEGSAPGRTPIRT
jgi:MFS family permease